MLTYNYFIIINMSILASKFYYSSITFYYNDITSKYVVDIFKKYHKTKKKSNTWGNVKIF